MSSLPPIFHVASSLLLLFLFRKKPPWLPAQLRGKHTNLNVELGGDSVPLRPSGGKKKPQLLFVLFFGTSSEVVQQYNRSQGGCGSNGRGRKRGRTGQSAQKQKFPIHAMNF